MIRVRMLTASCALLCSLIASTSHAAVIYTTELSGANEVPPNASTATGSATVILDGDLLTVEVLWSDLIGGNPAAAHIHCCTAPGSNVGVAIGFDPFPTTLSGFFTDTYDLLDASTYTAGFLTNFGGGTVEGARDALILGLNTNLAYVNIHNDTFQGGEIRGQLAQEAAAVPEPTSMLLLGSGLIALGARAHRRRQSKA